MKRWTIEEEEKLYFLLKNGKTNLDISIKLNRSEKSIIEKIKKLKIKKEILYVEICCLKCNKIINVPKNNKRQINRKFCSRSCSISYNNLIRTDEIKNKISKTLKIKTKEPNNICNICGNETKNPNNIFCSTKCHNKYKYEEYITRWKNGETNGLYKDGSTSKYIKRYIREKYNFTCVECGWAKKNIFTNNIPTEIEHIDGNCENNKEENLTLLCPSCHSLTETYKGANKGNGRYNRRKKYDGGKSY